MVPCIDDRGSDMFSWIACQKSNSLCSKAWRILFGAVSSASRRLAREYRRASSKASNLPILVAFRILMARSDSDLSDLSGHSST